MKYILVNTKKSDLKYFDGRTGYVKYFKDPYFVIELNDETEIMLLKSDFVEISEDDYFSAKK